MSKSFVELNDVKLRYSEGDDLALETTNMKIKKGEFVAVVGPSGCGKSSLLKLVSGLMPPSEGTVLVDNTEVDGPLKIVGMAFQNPTLLPWRTTLDNVLLPMEIVKPHRNRLRKHRAEYEERARKLLATVGLEGHEDKYPWELSGGMQQRASLCRSLIHEPDLLMLDEPFGAPKGNTVVMNISRKDAHISVCLEDEGVGIPEDELPLLFERFRRAHSNSGDDQQGIGLGLALVKATAERHGGRVEVHSTVGQGSRFCLVLPETALTV